MSDTAQKIKEIREALEGATPGPWKWIDSGGYDRKKLVGEYEIMNFGASMPYSEVAGQEPDDADAHLIANAPEWLGFLLSELEKRDEENQKLRKELDKQVEIGFSLECQLQSAQQEIELLKQERDKLIEGLRMCLLNHGCWREEDYVAYMRNILKEIGVTVE